MRELALPDDYSEEELITLAAASMALVLAVSQDISSLQQSTDEQVEELVHTLYLDITASSAEDTAARSEEEERAFTRRFLHYYRRTREVCGGDPQKFSLAQLILVGSRQAGESYEVALSNQLLIAACLPRTRSQVEPNPTGPAVLNGSGLSTILRAFWDLLGEILSPEPNNTSTDPHGAAPLP